MESKAALVIHSELFGTDPLLEGILPAMQVGGWTDRNMLNEHTSGVRVGFEAMVFLIFLAM